MMARCNIMENIHKKIGENQVIKQEPASDSDSEITCVLDLDRSGIKGDMNPDLPKIVQNEEKPAFIRPVLSVKCLYEDIVEPSASKCSDEESSSKYIDFNAVPELYLNSPTKATHQELSSSKSSYVCSSLNSKAVPELSLNSLVKVTPQESIHGSEVSNEAEEHPNLESQNMRTSTVICIPITIKQARPVISLRCNFKGIYNFMINVDCDTIPKKSESPAYSESRRKLYVCKDYPFKILVSAENVPAGSCLRFQAVYNKLESSSCPVVRCPTHAQRDFIKGCSTFEHVVQCVSDAAVYEKDTKTGRFSVSVPYEKPQDGTRFTTYLGKLTCFSSCSGGINRRPFNLVFTLEKDKIPLGRQTVETKVCACPLRDFKTDNEKEEKEKIKLDEVEKNSISENDEEMSKHEHKKLKPEESTRHHEPSQSSSSNGAKYSITVKDRELYDFLMHMKVLYEAGVHNLSPNT